jgi:small subunit ribosomal protein S4e
MTKNHLKRINAPKQWNILRKHRKFITRPDPGAHPLEQAMSLMTALKYYLNLGKNSREVLYLLSHHELLVDWRRKRDPKSQVGLFDTISIPKQNLYYRALFDDKGKLYFKKIDEKDSVLKVVKITDKTQVGKGIQVNLLDGRNILTDKSKQFKVGDSVLLELPNQKIKEIFPLEKGKPVFFYKGKFTGTVGTIDHIEKDTIFFKSKKGVFNTKKDFAIVIGSEKPAINIDVN